MHGDCDYCDKGKHKALPLCYLEQYNRIVIMYPDVDGMSNACPRCYNQIVEGMRKPKRRGE